jgi:hypothetical protein
MVGGTPKKKKQQQNLPLIGDLSTGAFQYLPSSEFCGKQNDAHTSTGIVFV